MIPVLDRIFARIDYKLGKMFHPERKPLPGENEIVGSYLRQGGQAEYDKLKLAVACVEDEERRLSRVYPNRERWIDYDTCLSRIFEVSQRRGQGVEPFAAEVDKIIDANRVQRLATRSMSSADYWAHPLGWPS